MVTRLKQNDSVRSFGILHLSVAAIRTPHAPSSFRGVASLPPAPLCASHNSFPIQARFLLSSPSCVAPILLLYACCHSPILPFPHSPTSSLSYSHTLTFHFPAPSGHSAAIRPPLGRRASLVVVRWFSLLTVLRASPARRAFYFFCARSMWWSQFFFSGGLWRE